MPLNEPTLEKIRELLSSTFELTEDETAPDKALFSSGRLDSFNLIELLGKLETEFGVKVGSGEVSLENLDTAQRMTDFLILKKKST